MKLLKHSGILLILNLAVKITFLLFFCNIGFTAYANFLNAQKLMLLFLDVSVMSCNMLQLYRY